MESITERMKKAVIVYIKKHGKEPKHILLGVKEAMEFKQHLEIVVENLSTKNLMFEGTVRIVELRNSKTCLEAA